MVKPVRITYRENVDHFIDAQNNVPQQSVPVVSRKIQNVFFALLIGGILLYVIFEEYRETGELIIPLLASGAVLLMAGFWCWLFKKLGWFRNREPQKYQWTEKDRIRFERSYRKSTGRSETIVVCEFDEVGFKLILEQGDANHCQWSSVGRAVEVPRGLFVYVRRGLYHWFPKRAFASEADFQTVLSMVASQVRRFECEGMAVEVEENERAKK